MSYFLIRYILLSCIHISFIEVEFTYYMIHLFKLYNLSVFLVYSQSCANVATVHFRIFSSFPKDCPVAVTECSHPNPFLQTEAASYSLCVSTDLYILDISEK